MNIERLLNPDELMRTESAIEEDDWFVRGKTRFIIGVTIFQWFGAA